MNQKDSVEEKINKLTTAIELLIQREVAPIAPVLPVAPVAPIAPIIPIVHSGDHDIITSLVISVGNLERKVDVISDKLDNKFTTKEEHQVVLSVQIDHEARIRLLEDEKPINDTVKKIVFGMITFILLAVLSAIVYLVVHR